MAVAQAQLADQGRELLRARQHMGQGVLAVGDLVDVEEYGAGNVPGFVRGACVAVLRRQGSRGVDDADIGRLEVGGQPFGADQGIGIGVGHPRALCFSSSQAGTGRPFSRRKVGLKSLPWYRVP